MQDQIFVEDSKASTGPHFHALFVHFTNLDRKNDLKIWSTIMVRPFCIQTQSKRDVFLPSLLAHFSNLKQQQIFKDNFSLHLIIQNKTSN